LINFDLPFKVQKFQKKTLKFSKFPKNSRHQNFSITKPNVYLAIKRRINIWEGESIRTQKGQYQMASKQVAPFPMRASKNTPQLICVSFFRFSCPRVFRV
jgi:hypothetical protein